MRSLSGNAVAMLELVVVGPVSYVPPVHQGALDELKSIGLVRQIDGQWYPTGSGLQAAGRTLH